MYVWECFGPDPTRRGSLRVAVDEAAGSNRYSREASAGDVHQQGGSDAATPQNPDKCQEKTERMPERKRRTMCLDATKEWGILLRRFVLGHTAGYQGKISPNLNKFPFPCQ